MDLPDDIKTLLLLRGNLLVSGLGSFVVIRTPARKSDSNQLCPPGSRIDFKEDRITQDPLLQKFLQNKYSISPEEAGECIFNFSRQIITGCSEELFPIGNFGSFRMNSRQTIEFTQSPDFNANPEGFGLFPLTGIHRNPSQITGKALPASTSVKKSIRPSDVLIALLWGICTFLAGALMVNYFTHGGVRELLERI